MIKAKHKYFPTSRRCHIRAPLATLSRPQFKERTGSKVVVLNRGEVKKIPGARTLTGSAARKVFERKSVPSYSYIQSQRDLKERTIA